MFKLILLFFFFVSCNALAVLDKFVGCFSSDSKKVNVKFVGVYDDSIPLSYVKYKNSQQFIPLLFSKKVEEDVGDGRPAEMTTTWLEVVDGKLSGQYTILSQGARFYSFSYKGKSGKIITMNENIDAYNDDRTDCIWK
ncbi:hypothetical protein M979_1897 [Buttiauxella noackiae ATCC 51607]|uniref:Lipoprotein n=1 Tax=Buttiauxella noackiae ATCC 51607 TaxID=1354255 RepID=A0A1B7HQY6_9ENTR|nr:hypothetical protein [Buttiauxella noackiae]OAT18068.1 hypothetical protein M979_1897 [Buttiauxella noackiae ATCC 51607]